MMTSIIVRADAKTNKPMAFIADSLDRGQMLAWNGKGEPEIVGIDSYHATKMVDENTANALAQKYARQFSTDINVRQRLPRNFRDGVTTIKAAKPKAAQESNVKKTRAPRISRDVKELAMQIAKLLAAK